MGAAPPLTLTTVSASDFAIRLLGPTDAAVLDRVADEVFDYPIDPRWTAECLADPRHHLAVAIDGGTVVGFASGFHYLHPDKPPQLFVNEVGVTPALRQRGIGRLLVDCLLTHARAIGCSEAWVLTDYTNRAARRLYAAAGGEDHPDATLMVTFPLGAFVETPAR